MVCVDSQHRDAVQGFALGVFPPEPKTSHTYRFTICVADVGGHGFAATPIGFEEGLDRDDAVLCLAPGIAEAALEREDLGLVELADGLDHDAGPAALNGDRVGLGQVVGGVYPYLVELGTELAAYVSDAANNSVTWSRAVRSLSLIEPGWLSQPLHHNALFTAAAAANLGATPMA